jgi:capsular polysaccharide transport system permease protein
VAQALLHPFHVWLNVINAILLRDIRVRAGKFYAGYLMIFLMPFLHLGAVLAVFVFTDRVPLVGTEPIIFFGLSILPFVVFVYPSRQILIGLAANRPLLHFPRVKVMDVILARGLLEVANGMMVSAVVFLVLSFVTGEFSPRDPYGVVSAILLTLYLGFAYGFVNALLAQLIPFWPYAINVVFPLLWVSSGIVFNPHTIPSPYKEYLAYNPLLQCAEYIRYSYYEDYPGDILDVQFVFWTATSIVAFGLLLERRLRRLLLSS